MSDQSVQPPQWLPEGFSRPEFVGSGGQAEVWKAHSHGSGEIVAIKRFLKGPGRFFYREFANQLSVKTPHAVKMYEFFDTPEGERLLVMEYCTGGNFADYLEDGPKLTTGSLLDLGKQLASALVAIHAQGLIHGDMKPENILRWRRHGVPVWKLCDFGIARHEVEQESIRSLTPAYASPEQKLGSPTLKSDIYSFGKVLDEACEEASMQSSREILHDRNFTKLRHVIQHCLKSEAELRPTATQLLPTLTQLQLAARASEYVDDSFDPSVESVFTLNGAV